MTGVPGLCVLLLGLLLGRAAGTETGTEPTETELTGTQPSGPEPEPSGGTCLGTRCFTVFTELRDFSSAQAQCRARGGGLEGHLLTVRSAVSQDVLTALLRNSSGRFWLGLRRSGGCPEPAAPLRGFRWVSGDQDGDFTRWAPPGPDGGCAASSCVSVSARDDFRWVPRPCGARAGFLCEYRFTQPCGALPAGGGAVRYRTPVGPVWGGDVLSLPPGSTAVRTPPGNMSVCVSGRWAHAPWSCEVQGGGCEYGCAVDPLDHAPACFCPPGQEVSPLNRRTCGPAPEEEEPCAALRCAHTCRKTAASYACVCGRGFRLDQDGRSCVDVDECRDPRRCPGDNARCVNTVGGATCVCTEGFRLAGGQCVDVDECASAPCEHLCTNTPGSYRCSCYDGYRADPAAPQHCKLHCGQEECPAECDPNDRFQCFCPDGYIAEERGVATVCLDMDECSFFYCEQDCENTFGGFLCSCSPGYTLQDGFRCVRNHRDTDPDRGAEGSGAPPAPTADPEPGPEPGPEPDPSGPPSSGGAVGVRVGVVVVSVVLVLVELQ